MLKALKVRLYLSSDQEVYVNKLLGSYRFVYNQCLDRKIKAYTNDKINLGLKELCNYFHQDLTKNEDYVWLSEYNTKVLKQSVINLLDSYKRFFVNGMGFPKFKKRSENINSCRFPLEAISKKNDYKSRRLTLSGIKNVEFRCSNKYINYLDKYKSGIRSATLSKCKSGKYFLSILVDSNEVKIVNEPINEFIGLDLGIKDFIVTSEGQVYENLKLTRNNKFKIAKLHKQLSRKQKGSKNKDKARRKLALLHEKLTNKKEDYLHKITNQLVNENQVIVIEDLNVKGMMQNNKLAKSIQELSLYRFKEMLRYKCIWYNRDLVEVNRFYPSSKLCSECGYKNQELTLKDREWVCSECGTNHNRDLNAAINIKNEGLRLYLKS